jgi:hypothetical protein
VVTLVRLANGHARADGADAHAHAHPGIVRVRGRDSQRQARDGRQ